MKLYSIKPGFKTARLAAHLTQQELADKLNVNLKTVMNWEQGLVTPSLETTMQLADLLHCDIDFLTGRIKCTTHDLQYIHDLTGLSESAIATISDWHKSEDYKHGWPALLSSIIEDDETGDLMKNLNLYAGTAVLSEMDFDDDAPGTNEHIKDKNIACLWHVSRIFSNIVERLFSKGRR